MFDNLHNFTKSWGARLLLFLIVLSFAAGGLRLYLGGHSPPGIVAKVNGEPIREIELLRVMQDEETRLRSFYGASFDPRAIDQNMLRQQALSRLIEQTLLLQEARREKLAISDEQIKKAVASMPAFQENGAFSYEHYKTLLARNNYTPAEFEEAIKSASIIQQLVAPYVAFTPPSWLAIDYQQLAEEQRIIRLSMLSLDENAVKVTEEESRNFYELNQQKFLRPARARLRYLVLGAAASEQSPQSLSEEEQRNYYKAHIDQFSQSEKRKVRHILVPDEKQAKAIYERLKANPNTFTEEAKKYSADEGSRPQGGELGWIGKGETVPEFESTVFALSKDQISQPFHSPFGWHIAQVEDLEPAKAQSFESVQQSIQKQMTAERQDKMLQEKKQKLHDLFDQGASLAEIAKALQLALQETDWISRSTNVDPWNKPQVQETIFSQEKMGLVPPIELDDGRILLAEVRDFEQDKVPPFEEVKAQAESLLRKEKAKRETATKGQAILAQNNPQLDFGNPITVGGNGRVGLSADILRQVMTTSGPFPKVTGIESKDGFVFVQIVKSEVPNIHQPSKEYGDMLASIYRQELLTQLLNDLKRKAKIQLVAPQSNP